MTRYRVRWIFTGRGVKTREKKDKIITAKTRVDAIKKAGKMRPRQHEIWSINTTRLKRVM